MNEKIKKYALIGGGVLVVLYIINKLLNSSPKPPSPMEVEPNALIDEDKVLSKGSLGIEVEKLQEKLGNLVVDGIFGVKTEARLKAVKGVDKITLRELN
jgi:peptidoglycan hydrolase-like protein with peptidoglycan-binding domain